ncbi:MAG: hypothetical protein JWO31_2379 [Phycisphaerales bacterium]|nr:hypothetical protein [Phycisphaerales bacterium]
MEQLLPALLIFSLRICDVSIGTLRMLYAMRGRKYLAAGLGLIESGVFIFAISSALATARQNPWNMVGYAAGFATGTFVGMTLETWIASGTIIARIISKQRCQDLAAALRAAGFGLTAVDGHGQSLQVMLLFVVAPRKRGKEMLKIIADTDPEAFITVDTVGVARGGYIPHLVRPTSVRK